MMMNLRLLAVAVLSASLSACNGFDFGVKQDADTDTATSLTVPPSPADAAKRSAPAVAVSPSPQYPTESAVYACENVSAVRVIRTDDAAQPHMKVIWLGREYTMQREEGQGSGLPRFSDRANGLTWVDLPWKGVLLDSRTEKPILSDCKPASGEQLAQANKILEKHAAEQAKASKSKTKTKAKTKSKTKTSVAQKSASAKKK